MLLKPKPVLTLNGFIRVGMVQLLKAVMVVAAFGFSRLQIDAGMFFF
jgi:hypothetical protein